MVENKYLKELTKQIHNKEMRDEIRKEYEDHIEDCKEALISSGMSEEEAEEEAVRQMGDPTEAGREMDQLYRRVLDWRMLIWTMICGTIMILFDIAISHYGSAMGIDGNVPDLITNVIGGACVLIGLVWSAVEKWTDTPTFYAWGKNWNGGGVTNSGVFLALGVLFVGKSEFLAQMIYFLLMLVTFQLLERALIEMYRHKRENQLLWEIGTAETTILPYKGMAAIGGKSRKVETKKGEEIPQGAPVMVIELDGMKPVVVQV